MNRVLRFVPGCAVLAASIVSAQADDWPQFRGPTGMGIVAERGLPTKWGGPTDENIAWKALLPGIAEKGKPDHNQSSPVVRGERVFVTTVIWPDGRDTSEMPDHHVSCYAVNDGRLLWDTLVQPGPWKLSDLRGGYGAPTPAADAERVYVVFGSAVVAAIDNAGALVWRHELADYASFDVAISASPIVHDGAVYLLCDRNAGKSVLTAYDANTGRVRWEQKRPQVAFAHSTPTLAEVGGRLQLLVSASNALQGLDPANGDVLWWVKTPGDVCSPITSNGLIYSDSGRGGRGVLVEPGTGDVTATAIKWTIPQIPEGLSSPVVAGGRLFRLHNPSILKCFDLETGKEVFATRLDGASIASSPLVTPEGLIYCASAGRSFVVNAGPEFDLVATSDLGDPCAASPAVSEGRIFLKGKRQLYCVKPRGE